MLFYGREQELPDDRNHKLDRAVPTPGPTSGFLIKERVSRECLGSFLIIRREEGITSSVMMITAARITGEAAAAETTTEMMSAALAGRDRIVRI